MAPARSVLQVIAMRKSRLLLLAPLMLALMLSACGNKGDLVKPNPAAVPPKTDQPAAPPAPDGTPKPPQDSSGGH
jgi:predicted small lipoprotein YifL